MDSHSYYTNCGMAYQVQEDMGFSAGHMPHYCYIQHQVKSACPSEIPLSGQVPLDPSLTRVLADSQLA